MRAFRTRIGAWHRARPEPRDHRRFVLPSFSFTFG